MHWDSLLETYVDDDGNAVDPSGNPAGPARRIGTSDNPNYDNTTNQPDGPPVGGGVDPWGQHPGDPSYGYPPGTDPAWDRAGYNPNPTPPPTAPTPPTGGGGGGGGGSLSNLLSPYPGSFVKPDMSQAVKDALGLLPAVPEFHPAEIPTIDAWHMPTWQEVQSSDPGYEGRRKSGEQALVNSKAAQGLVRTGGSLKDLLNYNQDYASQEYGAAANRSLTGWRNNADVTLQRSGMDLDRSKAMFEPQFAEYQNKVGVASRVPQETLDNAWREYLKDYDIWKDQRDSTFDKLSWDSTFARDSAAM